MGKNNSDDIKRIDLYIGAHVSAAGGVSNAPVRASEIGATAFALFTKNQRQWSAPPLKDQEIQLFKDHCVSLGYTAESILPHASYLINLGQPDEQSRRKSADALLDEVKRCNQLGITMVNVHPGAHLGKISEKECFARIGQSVNEILDQSEGVTIVLENTAGQGSTVGYRFEHLTAIMEHIRDQSRIGICMDTCHSYAAGYDLSTQQGFSDMIQTLKKLFGSGYFRGVHMNDSKKSLGSRVDRHASLGKGELGWKPFHWIVNEPFFRGIPLLLETPDPDNWPKEIARLFTFDTMKAGSKNRH